MRNEWWIGSIVGVVTLVMMGGLDAQSAGRLSGSVTAPARLQVAAGAVVEVTLDDVSRADAVPAPLARAILDVPLRWPLAFTLAYDPAAIHPGRRYAVRARVVDGDRTIMASAGTALVLTQGHGDAVTVPLVAVPGPPVQPAPESADRPAPLSVTAEVAQAPVALPPPVAVAVPLSTRGPVPSTLGSLPATFTGVLPCADCAGRRYHLNLFPDDSYVLRTTAPGGAAAVDRVGSWALSSDRRAVALDRPDGPPEVFALNDALSLRLLDAAGQSVARADLRRSASFQPLDVTLTARGVWRSSFDVNEFTECSTGQTWLLTGETALGALARAAGDSGRLPGEPIVVTMAGALREGAPGETGLSRTFAASDVVAVHPTEGCDPRFASPSLMRTAWQLTEIGGQPIAAVGSAGLVLEAETGQFSGAEAGGCARLIGSYDVVDGAIAFLPAGTLTVSGCATEAADAARTLAEALRYARSYRIVGRTLELFGADRVRLARFQAS